MRGYRGLIIVGVVLDVEMLQYWLQTSALLFPTLLGARRFGVQVAFGQQRLLRRRQLACFKIYWIVFGPDPLPTAGPSGCMFRAVAGAGLFLLDLDAAAAALGATESNLGAVERALLASID